MTNPACSSLWLKEAELSLFFDRINVELPCLKDDLQGLSDHLSFFIQYSQLPPRKLQFELLSRDELESMPFKELFKPCPLREDTNVDPLCDGSSIEGNVDKAADILGHSLGPSHLDDLYLTSPTVLLPGLFFFC
jgi:hypothetical protein